MTMGAQHLILEPFRRAIRPREFACSAPGPEAVRMQPPALPAARVPDRERRGRRREDIEPEFLRVLRKKEFLRVFSRLLRTIPIAYANLALFHADRAVSDLLASPCLRCRCAGDAAADGRTADAGVVGRSGKAGSGRVARAVEFFEQAAA